MKNIFGTACLLGIFLGAAISVSANLPGGGTGAGANVTITDNGNGTVTMANGIVSIIITTNDASIHTINYTFNNTGTTQTANLLTGAGSSADLYWFQNPGSFIAGPFTYSVVANNGNYAEIDLVYAAPTNGVFDIHYSMLRGSPGFYATPILTHRAQDGVTHIELRPNIYAGATFNWMSVDANRNKIMAVASSNLSIPVQGAPKEVYLWTNGIYAGQYDDKYKYTADLAQLNCWGWSSVGTGGLNIGLWNITASPEYYPAGPMERSLMEHIGTTILNTFTGGYYGLGFDNDFLNGELWSKTYGPYFYYMNNVTNSYTSASQASQALYSDALAQGAAEQSAWPYSWLTNASYTAAAGRGAITGKLVIADSGNPNASAAGMWVGVAQQPTVDVSYDFQQWTKPYQFWVKTDTNGNFTIPNVIATTNCTLFAFGIGAAGTFQSQNLTGGNPPILYNLPATPFSVTVTGGATNNLGTVTWTPTRVGSTVFEIGYPNRTGAKFRHGDDFWVGDIGPSVTSPSPVWSKWLEYPFDFPNGVNYTVGQSRWTTDWNFIQPVVTDSQGNYNPSTSTIAFNLASAPANGATASIYLGLCSDYYSAIVVTVNGVNAGSISGLSGSPNAVPTTGYYAAYASSDSNIREGNNGAFTDERLTFPATALHAGYNTITFSFREIAANYFADHFMYDYLRLELTGYVPPAPAGVAAYAGNNGVLVSWPVTPGATSYKVLRATAVNGTYSSVTNGVVGPVCGSGANNATWLDTTAVNGSAYYYEVQSVNPTGTSASSVASAGASPSSSLSTSAPSAPTGLVVSSSGHQSVTLNWSASTGASYYSVWRSVLANTGGGSSNTLNTILLNNTNTATSYTDGTPTDGSIYSYYVTAGSAGGTSGNSLPVVAKALPVAPSLVPVSLTASFVQTTNIVLNWTAVPGAVGYVISRATSSAGPYTYLQTVTETTYTDTGLNAAVIYYYRVAAMNGAGTSANVTDAVNSQQTYPTNLVASGTNAAIILTWPATTGATSYNVKRGTSYGNETTTVVTGYGGTSYTNSGLVNGTTYYYVVTATGTGGTSGNSPEASATPFATSSGIWTAAADGNWGDAGNWSGGEIATGPGSTADFSTLSLTTNVTVTLDSARTISGMIFGDTTATYNWTVAGSNPLTLGTLPSVDVANETASLNVPLAGTAGLTKTGPGTLVIGGATNTLTGGLTVNAGTLTLDYTPAGSPGTNLLPAANALTLGGGALQVNGGSPASSQTLAATALNAGLSVVAGTNEPTVNLGTLTANAGGLVEFVGPATVGAGNVNAASNANLTTTVLGSNAFVPSSNVAFFDANYATVGLYDYAATAGSAPPYTIVGGSQVSGFYTNASGTAPAAGNLDVMGNITGWVSQPYLTSLRFNTSIGGNISVAATGSGSTLTLDDILVTPNVGAYNVSMNSGSLRPAGGSSSYPGPYVIWQNNPAGELILNSTLGNSKVGAAAYAQAGPGTVSIPGTSSGYTGQSYLNGGVTLMAGNGSIGAAATGAAVNLNGGTLMANDTFALANGGTNQRPFTLLNNGGGLAVIAGNTLTVDGVVGSAAGTGPLTIGIPASSANNHTPGLLPGTGTGTANTAVYATGTVILSNANYYTGGTVLQSGTLNFNGLYALGGANYGGITFTGGILQYVSSFPGNNGSSDLTSVGTAGVTLAAGGGTVDLNGNAVTYAGAIGNNGMGGLTVQSTLAGGSLNLQGADSYAGDTTVSNATLLVNNASGSATGTGDVTVQNSATLGGNGTVAGSVTVQNGGTLVPGDLTDALNVGNNLTLAAGSQTTVQLQHSPLENSSVTVGGTLTEGGTLTVSNAGGPLANGDSFQVFTAGNYAGTFSQVNLPALNAGLLWETNQLATAGTVTVIPAAPPVIGSVSVGGGNLTLAGTGGIANGMYYVLATTNLTAPWTILATNPFDASGNFTATNTLDPTQPQMFFKIQLP